jgi:hypothetical protein
MSEVEPVTWTEGAPANVGGAWWGLDDAGPFVFIAGQATGKAIRWHAPYTTGQPHPPIPVAEVGPELPEGWRWAFQGGTYFAQRADGGPGVVTLRGGVVCLPASGHDYTLSLDEIEQVGAAVRERNSLNREQAKPAAPKPAQPPATEHPAPTKPGWYARRTPSGETEVVEVVQGIRELLA